MGSTVEIDGFGMSLSPLHSLSITYFDTLN